MGGDQLILEFCLLTGQRSLVTWIASLSDSATMTFKKVSFPQFSIMTFGWYSNPNFSTFRKDNLLLYKDPSKRGWCRILTIDYEYSSYNFR